MGADPTPAGGQGHPVGTCYLLHFDQRYEHAGHYTGFAEGSGLLKRLGEHQGGRGARLLAVITQAGIGFRLARTWPGVTRARERQLKNQGGASRYCPICQDQRKARGIPRRATPSRTAPAARAGRNGRQPAGPPERPDADAVPTRGTTPGRVAAFLALNPGFARPVRASLAGQWGRARGREAVELLGPRVTTAWFEENRQLSQQRAAVVTRRAARARTHARQQQAAEQAEQARLHAIAARTSQRLAAARQHAGERAAGGQRPDWTRQEAEHAR
jgi:hypothetical protein